MRESDVKSGGPAVNWTSIARRLLTLGENRFALMLVEFQEERILLVHAFLLALCVGICTFLAWTNLTVVVVIAFWAWSPVGILLILAGLYAAIAFVLYQRLIGIFVGRQAFSASVDQFRKDRKSIEKALS